MNINVTVPFEAMILPWHLIADGKNKQEKVYKARKGEENQN